MRVQIPGVTDDARTAVAGAVAAADADARALRHVKSRAFFALLNSGKVGEREPLAPAEKARRKKARQAARASRKGNR